MSRQTTPLYSLACGATRLQLLARAGHTERFISKRIKQDSIHFLTTVEARRVRELGGPERYYHRLAAHAYKGLRFEVPVDVETFYALARGETIEVPRCAHADCTVLSWGQTQEACAPYKANRILLHEQQVHPNTLFMAEAPVPGKAVVKALESAVTYRELGTLYAGQQCFSAGGRLPCMAVVSLDVNQVRAISLAESNPLTPFLGRLLRRQGIPTILIEE